MEELDRIKTGEEEESQTSPAEETAEEGAETGEVTVEETGEVDAEETETEKDGAEEPEPKKSAPWNAWKKFWTAISEKPKRAMEKPLPEWLRGVLATAALGAVLLLMLSILSTATQDAIREGERERYREQMERVMPRADAFSETPFDRTRADDMYAGFRGSELVGYCVKETVRGFSGEIELLVGVDINGSVTGVELLEHREMAEAGAQVEAEDFLRQYIGKSGTIQVNGQRNTVEAVSGATISSRAVTEGVNGALSAVANLPVEGVEIDGEGEV